jgi:shikimate kinase
LQGNIYLIGLMGAGKTTVGRKLAGIASLDFIDSDQLLESRMGVSISHIFEIEGEAGFRLRESKLFDEISSGSGAVVSTGGGLVLDENNRRLMINSGEVVYLRASLDILWKRLRNCSTRPLLKTANPKRNLQDLIEDRDPIYTNLANQIIDVNSGSPNKTAIRICQALGIEAG